MRIEFWYEFASPYSYLSAVRIEALAWSGRAQVTWRPFLLGPIFQAQGWSTSPFKVYPAKGRHMVRDMQRRSACRGLSFVMPDQFPANGVKAARIALVGQSDGWAASFTKAVFAAGFGAGEDIASTDTLAAILAELGIDPMKAIAASEEPAVKEALRSQTALAQQQQIFGSPTFVTPDGELFWGDDRLEDALDWMKSMRDDRVA